MELPIHDERALPYDPHPGGQSAKRSRWRDRGDTAARAANAAHQVNGLRPLSSQDLDIVINPDIHAIRIRNARPAIAELGRFSRRCVIVRRMSDSPRAFSESPVASVQIRGATSPLAYPIILVGYGNSLVERFRPVNLGPCWRLNAGRIVPSAPLRHIT